MEYRSPYHARIARALEGFARQQQDETAPARWRDRRGATAMDTPTDRSRDMIPTPAQEVHMETWSEEDTVLLTLAMEAMRNDQSHPKWTQPPLKMERAKTAILQGRVTPGYPPGLYHITGNSGHYTVDPERCTCDGFLKGKTTWCTHRTAVELYRRWQALKAAQPPWRLPLPPTTPDERLAQVPDEEEQITFTTGEVTEEETPVSETTTEFYPATSNDVDVPLEAPRMAQDVSRPAQVLRLAPRQINAIIADLSRPLPQECIDTLSRGGTRIQFLHWHTVAAVLDAYATGWQGAVVRVDKIGEKCSVTYRITIPAAEGLCSREDSGMEDEDKDDYGDAMTNATATAFKRAAAKFGLGRWLYDTKEHTTKFAAKLRGEREALLKALAEAADQAGIPRAKVIDWLKHETGCHRNADIPAWALRDALTQLQGMTTSAA